MMHQILSSTFLKILLAFSILLSLTLGCGSGGSDSTSDKEDILSSVGESSGSSIEGVTMTSGGFMAVGGIEKVDWEGEVEVDMFIKEDQDSLNETTVVEGLGDYPIVEVPDLTAEILSAIGI